MSYPPVNGTLVENVTMTNGAAGSCLFVCCVCVCVRRGGVCVFAAVQAMSFLCTLTIDLSFVCYAELSGGSVYIFNGDINLVNVSVSNSVSQLGGAFAFVESSTATLDNVTVTNCSYAPPPPRPFCVGVETCCLFLSAARMKGSGKMKPWMVPNAGKLRPLVVCPALPAMSWLFAITVPTLLTTLPPPTQCSSCCLQGAFGRRSIL